MIDEMIKNSKSNADLAKVFVKLCLQGELEVSKLKQMLAALGYELKPLAEKYLINNMIRNSIISNRDSVQMSL